MTFEHFGADYSQEDLDKIRNLTKWGSWESLIIQYPEMNEAMDKGGEEFEVSDLKGKPIAYIDLRLIRDALANKTIAS